MATRGFRRGVACVLFVSVAAAVVAGARNVGIAWAENDYLDHMDGIVVWAREAWALGLGDAVARLTGAFWETATGGRSGSW